MLPFMRLKRHYGTCFTSAPPTTHEEYHVAAQCRAYPRLQIVLLLHTQIACAPAHIESGDPFDPALLKELAPAADRVVVKQQRKAPRHSHAVSPGKAKTRRALAHNILPVEFASEQCDRPQFRIASEDHALRAARSSRSGADLREHAHLHVGRNKPYAVEGLLKKGEASHICSNSRLGDSEPNKPFD